MLNTYKYILIFLCFLSSSFTQAASSKEIFKSERSEVQLLSSLDSVSEKSKEFYLSLSFKLAPEWHIYWINSGDSGTPPTLDWNSSSQELSFSEIIWPSPTRIPTPPLMTYGYEHQVDLPLKVTLLEAPKSDLKINLKANWLICKIECVPESQIFSLILSLKNFETQSSEAEIIQKAISKHPETTLPLKISHSATATHYTFHIEAPTEDLFTQLESVYFFPFNSLKIKHASTQTLEVLNSKTINLLVERDENDASSAEKLEGILELKNSSATQFAKISSIEALPPRSPLDLEVLAISALFAFLGGLLLNLMPCVFPVLFLKLLALTKNTLLSSKEKKQEAWSYFAGVVSSFLVLAFVLFLLKKFGFAVGWGFQLQNPAFVSLSALLFIAMGLSLLGVYEISGSFVGAGQSLTQKNGLKGSFFTGVLATLVATPCSAPFMGSAIGYALSRQSWESFPIFLLLGVGLASPYVLLAYYPSLLKWIPKPGPWMERLKEFFGFALLGTALWLLWIYGTQKGSDALILLLGSGLFLSMGLWALRINSKKTKLALVLCSLLGTFVFLDKTLRSSASAHPTSSTSDRWESFSPEKLDEYLRQNKAVFIDYTASWCLTCQVNKKLVLTTPEANKLFEDNKIITLKADWTLYDPIITQSLSKLGRQSVPVYAYYGAGKKEAVLLPELLTLTLLKKAILEN